MKKYLPLIIGIMAFGLAPRAFAAPLLVSTSSHAQQNGTATTTITNPAMNVAAGNLLVLACRAAQSTDTITASDTAANSFAKATSTLVSGLGMMDIFYATGTVANASDVVRCNFGQSTSYDETLVLQYSGIATASAIDS